jgi:hypothetical protein
MINNFLYKKPDEKLIYLFLLKKIYNPLRSAVEIVYCSFLDHHNCLQTVLTITSIVFKNCLAQNKTLIEK